MNRSFRAQESQMTVNQRKQVAASLRNSMIMEKGEDLALFLDMRKRDKEREKERDSLLLHIYDEFEEPLGSKPGASPIFNIASSTPAPLCKTGPDDFLNSENDKNDYDWLLTPPGTPLFTSLEMDAQKTYMSHLGTPNGRSTSLNSRLAYPQIEIPKRNSLVPKQPSSCPVFSSTGIRRPSLSGGRGSGSRPVTPTGRSTLISTSRSVTPTGHPTFSATSRTSRPSTPNSRASLSLNNPTMPATSRSAGPTRSTTPLSRPVARSATPTGRASIPASKPTSRASTPTCRPSASISTNNTSGTLSRSSCFLAKSVNSGISLTRPSGTAPTKTPSVRSVTSAPKSSAPSRAPSPTVKSRTWKPSDMPGFSMDVPPNLRTSAPERPLSASRGRPLSTGRSSSIESGSAGRPKRQSCSPSRGQLSNCSVRSSGSSVPAPRRTPKSNDSVNPILMGTRMVERVINMRKLAPPQDDKHSPSLSGKSASSPDSTGFGRTLSKKSLDMAIRHMDIKRSIPGNLWPLMSNIPASSMYSVRSGSGVPTRGRTMSVSDSPLATSSNASSELSFNNNGFLNLDMSELEDDIRSDRGGVRTPSSIWGR